jgi:hypothetical protein
MDRRFFWAVPEFAKFRTIFENEDTILGKNEANEHRLFRKDTGKICFDERQALLLCVAALIKDEEEEGFFIKRREVVCV